MALKHWETLTSCVSTWISTQSFSLLAPINLIINHLSYKMISQGVVYKMQVTVQIVKDG